MKQIILFFLFSVISLGGYSQFNLQFNQVLTYTGKIVNTDSSATWVVPASKVWKIESMSNIINTCNSFVLNNFAIKNANYPTNGGYTENYYSPIWLKAGDAIKFRTSCSGTFIYYISIIEYNLIP